jgi:hypothetical protein
MKRLIRVFAAILSFLLLGIFAFIVSIPYFIEGDRFRRTVADELSSASGLTAEVGKLSFSFPRGIGIRLKNFELREDWGRSLIRSEEIFLGIRALPLLRRKLIIHQLVLTGPKVQWVRDQQGRAVLLKVLDTLILKMQNKEKQMWLQPSFQLSKVGVDGGILYLGEPGDPVRTFYNVQFAIRKGALLNRLQMKLSAQLEPDKTEGWVQIVGRTKIPAGLLDLGSNPVTLDVAVDSLSGPRLRAYLEEFIGLDEIEGVFKVQARLEGVFAKEMKLKGRAEFSALSMTMAKIFTHPKFLGNGRLDFKGVLSPRKIQFTTLNLGSSEISFESSLLVEDQFSKDPLVQFQLKSPDIEIGTVKEYLPIRILRGPVWPYLNRVLTKGKCRFEQVGVLGRVTALKRIGSVGFEDLLRMKVDCMDGAADLVGDNYLPVRNLMGKMVLENGLLRFVDFRGNYGKSNLKAQGELKGVFVGDEILRLDVKGDLDLTQIRDQFGLRLFGAETGRISSEFKELGGQGTLNLQFLGEFGEVDRYHYEGSVSLHEAYLHHRLLPLPASQIRGVIRFSPNEIYTAETNLNYGSTQLVLRGGITDYTASDPIVRLSLATEKGRFAEVASLLFPQVRASDPGSITGQVQLQGKLGQWKDSQMTGAIEFRDVDLNLSFLREPLKSVQATAKLNGTALAFQGSGLLVGRPIRFSLQMRNRNEPNASIDLSGKGVDLALFFPEAGFGQKREGGDLYGALRVVGRVDFEQSRIEDRPLDFFSADFGLRDRVWELTRLYMRSGGGRFRGKGFVSDRLSSEGVRFEVEGKVEAFDLRELFLWAGLPPTESTGKVSLEGKLNGFGTNGVERKKNLTGTLHVRSEKGIVKRFPALVQILNVVDFTRWLTLRLPDFNSQGLPYKSVTADIQVKDGHYKTENLLLDSDLVKITAAGGIDSRTSAIDFKVAVRPFATVDNLVGKIPLIGAGLSLIQGSVVVAHLRVHGTMDEPRIVAAPQDTLTDFFRRALQLPQSLIPFSKKEEKKEPESLLGQ